MKGDKKISVPAKCCKCEKAKAYKHWAKGDVEPSYEDIRLFY